MKNKTIIIAILLLGLFSLFGYFSRDKVAVASAPSGLPATVYDVQSIAVGPDYNTLLYASNDRCSSRVVSTRGQAVMLNFATTSAQATSTSYLSSVKGLWQGASTTVAYDSGVYGCGAFAAYGVVASTTITISENR